MDAHVTQLKIDLRYTDYSEVVFFYEAVKRLTDNSKFGVEIMDDGNAPYTEDMTEQYKDLLANQFSVGGRVVVDVHEGSLYDHAFTGTVKCIEKNSIRVIDQDGNIWDCNPSAVKKEEYPTDTLTEEQAEEQAEIQRRDEKHGLYPEHEDIAN